MRPKYRNAAPLMLLAAILGSCSDPSGPAAPAEVQAVSNTSQEAVAGSEVADSLVVRVSDVNGDPAAGVEVSWVVTTGDGSVSPISTTTDSGGRARTSWTLGATAGPNEVRSEVQGLAPVVFTALGVAGPVSSLEVVSGDSQEAAAGEAVPDSLVVLVVDSNDNPVQDVVVDWEVTAGGGSVNPPSAPTNSEGYVGTSWTLGMTPGANEAQATVPDLIPAVFTAEGVVGPASSIEVVSGDGQEAAPGEAVPDSLVVLVTDASGNPVQDVVVDWEVTAGGGSVSPTSTVTNVTGDTEASWTLGVAAGPNEARATVQGLPPAVFNAVSTPVFQARHLVSSRSHRCAIALDDMTYCWGSDSHGQLGTGEFLGPNEQRVPLPVAGGHEFVSLHSDTYANRTCGLLADGTAYCWGEGEFGGLGDGESANRPYPVAVAGRLKFTSLALGSVWTCGATTEGEIYCWGWNQLIAGETPQRLDVDPGGFVEMTAGQNNACARRTDGTAVCWWVNEEGQLGDGTWVNSDAPVEVAGSQRFVAIEMGGEHVCGISADGGVYCWGMNWWGQVGDGTELSRNVPTEVVDLTSAVDIGLLHPYTWAVTEGGGFWHWGNGYGERLSRSSVPAEVVLSAGEGVAVVAPPCLITEARTVYCLSAGAFDPVPFPDS